MIVGRFYILTFKTEVRDDTKMEMKAQIIGEIRELPNVRKAEFTGDPEGLAIFTEDGEYTEVMNRIVNIVSREAAGAELSFRKFLPEEEKRILLGFIEWCKGHRA